MLPKVDLFGVQVTRATLDEIVRAAHDAVRARSRASLLVAVNVHTYVEALRRGDYREVLNRAAISWPDGVPIEWAAKLAGRPIGPRVHGHDLMLRFFQEPFRHFFYGSTPETLQAIRTRMPHLKIAGTFSPPFGKSTAPADVSMINDSGADIAWIALGAPKQELWASANLDRINVPIVACVGAAFDILAGKFGRAPRRVQKMGLEWAWRLGQDPGRLWRRYFSTNGAFVSHVVASTFGRSASPHTHTSNTPR